MWDFIKENIFLFFCIFALIWLAEVVLTQIKYKKKGIRLDATVVDHVNQSGNYFPVYEFDYNGETIRIDSYNGEKNPAALGSTETVYYLPGNKKGVFSEKNIGIKAWQIICAAAAVLYIVARLISIFTK